MLINRTHALKVLDAFDRAFAASRQPNDVLLTNMAASDRSHFVAMDPQLCNENEQGGSTQSG